MTTPPTIPAPEGTPVESAPDGETVEQTDPPAGNEETPAEGEPAPEGEPPAEEAEVDPQVRKLRDEAASYRVRAREAEEKLKGAKTLDEVNEIVAQMTTDREAGERALLVELVQERYSLPEALVARLQGNTREELEADAKALAQLVGHEVGPLSGGLTPGIEPESTDPRELAARYGRRPRR